MHSSALLAAAAAIGATPGIDPRTGQGLPVPGLAGRNLAEAAPGISWQKAPCRFCGTGCHIMVGTRGGKVVAVAGDRKADVNKGLLCVKGYNIGQILYGKDRLTQPLRRKGGKLVPISWKEAPSCASPPPGVWA